MTAPTPDGHAEVPVEHDFIEDHASVSQSTPVLASASVDRAGGADMSSRATKSAGAGTQLLYARSSSQVPTPRTRPA